MYKVKENIFRQNGCCTVQCKMLSNCCNKRIFLIELTVCKMWENELLEAFTSEKQSHSKYYWDIKWIPTQVIFKVRVWLENFLLDFTDYNKMVDWGSPNYLNNILRIYLGNEKKTLYKSQTYEFSSISKSSFTGFSWLWDFTYWQSLFTIYW